MKSIILPIYFETPEMRQQEQLGMGDRNIEDSKVRPIEFFNINALGVYMEDEKEYGLIHCNGDTYICPLLASEIRAVMRYYENGKLICHIDEMEKIRKKIVFYESKYTHKV